MNLANRLKSAGIEVRGSIERAHKRVLTLQAMRFVAALAREFRKRREELLMVRRGLQVAINKGLHVPDFLSETAHVRNFSWKIAEVPADLKDRRVEITGPVERKMIINALNSGANVFMADFEDSHSPTWEATVEGQVNLCDAVDGTIEYVSPENGKKYKLNEKIATLMVRPRGWHLLEKHVLVDGEPVPAGLFDFGLYFFHNAKKLLQKGTGPYFYLPKLENWREAKLWNDVFICAQDLLMIPRGTIKATVLIETILAAFQMDEILFELREHSAGLNCGRWDYIFSFIKKFSNHPGFVLPDRGSITMEKPFLNAYVSLLIQTCHRRGAHAMGGMAAQIPIRNNPAANAEAMEKVRNDKIREALAGHDGTWVAHPGLVPVAKDIFDRYMQSPNQLSVLREDVSVTAADLLRVPAGDITENGLRANISVGLRYLEAWLRGVGCVPINNLMEDAATAEISRAQIWQWLRHRAKLSDGRTVTPALFEELFAEEFKKILEGLSEGECKNGKYRLAAVLFDRLVRAEKFEEFLTLPAYECL